MGFEVRLQSSRPAEFDQLLRTRVPTPNSPSYPSEHAAVAAAAAGVLAYFFPNGSGIVERTGRKRPHDLAYMQDYNIQATIRGSRTRTKVAARVIERAKADNSDVVWTGTVPVGPGLWIGTNPGNANATNWKTFVSRLASQFDRQSPRRLIRLRWSRKALRSGISPNIQHESEGVLLAESGRPGNLVLDIRQQTIVRNQAGSESTTCRSRLRPAWSALFDTWTASQDGKFTYWYIRPRSWILV